MRDPREGGLDMAMALSLSVVVSAGCLCFFVPWASTVLARAIDITSAGALIRLQRIYNFWLLHAILSTVLDIIGLYYPILYYFGTNLLTGGPTENCCFLPVLGFRRKGISNGVQTEWNLRERDFLTEYNSGDLDHTSRHVTGGHEVGCTSYPTRRAPTLVGPCCSTDVLLPPIYTHVPRKHPGSQRKTISTAVTFCIHEIPSWSLHRRSAGGGIDHGGLLHQHHSPSDELWVVYHRPSGP